MLVVALHEYGDFDMPILNSVWTSSEFDSLTQTGLSSDTFDYSDINNAIKQLRKLGFKNTKIAIVTVGGGF